MADAGFISALKTYLEDNGLVLDSTDEQTAAKLPPLRRLVYFFKSKEVRNALDQFYTNVDILAGGTFSGMPVAGIFTFADDFDEKSLKEMHQADIMLTKSIWNNIQDENYFKSIKDWALYYSNVVSALSGIFCLRYFLFEDHENFIKYKQLIKGMKYRDVSPMIGVYGFACDLRTGNVLSPSFTFWIGAGAFRPANLSKFLKSRKA
ncbi:hypothetical protein HZC34_03870 [Candidatus Saganbacteria bacterium]|nr:hypothetical protein [Candidatus Saganbacteria bacterium]